jgi:hypothetical protein
MLQVEIEVWKHLELEKIKMKNLERVFMRQIISQSFIRTLFGALLLVVYFINLFLAHV